MIKFKIHDLDVVLDAKYNLLSGPESKSIMDIDSIESIFISGNSRRLNEILKLIVKIEELNQDD